MDKEYSINDGKFHPLVHYYNATREYYLNEKSESTELFVGSAAQKYINKQFSNERKCTEIKKCLDKITEFRAQHTVSAFLLGLTLKKSLQLNTRDWRRLPGESKSGKGSFRLFWSWICLFHDIGYSYEEPSTDEKRKEYEKIVTVDDFIRHENIKYNLLDYSENRDLISRYYSYRVSQNKLDHGIVGALLLFNALMILAENSKYNKVYSEIKEYKDFYVRICDAIAKHNMWRATPATEEIYKEYGLFKLIPSSNMQHKIFYKDNTLEFLLNLVDTIDPLKSFYRDNRSKDPINITQILNEVRIRFFKNQKAFVEEFDHPLFKSKIKQYINPKDSLDSWLGVWITVPENAEFLRIEIDVKGTAYADNMIEEEFRHDKDPDK